MVIIQCDDARPYIDEIGEYFVETYFKEDLEELHKELNTQVELNRELYGGNDSDTYKENKLEDFHKRIGNAVISVMKKYDENQSQNFDHLYTKKQTISVLKMDVIVMISNNLTIYHGSLIK